MEQQRLQHGWMDRQEWMDEWSSDSTQYVCMSVGRRQQQRAHELPRMVDARAREAAVTVEWDAIAVCMIIIVS